MAKDAKGYKQPAPPHTTNMNSNDGAGMKKDNGDEVFGEPTYRRGNDVQKNPYLKPVRPIPEEMS